MWWLVSLLAVVAGIGGAAIGYSIVFPRQPFTGPLPELTAAERELMPPLSRHITAVASVPHNVSHYANLEAAANYIEAVLVSFGYHPEIQRYFAGKFEVRNIEISFEPQFPGAQTRTLVFGAHYDSHHESPGANDNGTGVAAALEIARRLKGYVPKNDRLRLVFWVNEENPFGHTKLMGSWQHARRLKESSEPVVGMIALETLGYFSQEPGSQKFPAPFGLIYPDRGNFVAFVGLPGSRTFLRHALSAFRDQQAFPSIGGVAPGFLDGIALSDHWAYHQFGFPAFMITDTAPFRNPYYHADDDLPHTVDYESLARITLILERMLRRLLD